jgi:hypothetical protein
VKREELRLVGNGVSELSASEPFYIQTLSRIRHPFGGLETPTKKRTRRREYENPGKAAAPTQIKSGIFLGIVA